MLDDKEAERIKRRLKAAADRVDMEEGRKVKSAKMAKRSNRGIKRGGGGTHKSVWPTSGGAIERNRRKF